MMESIRRQNNRVIPKKCEMNSWVKKEILKLIILDSWLWLYLRGNDSKLGIFRNNLRKLKAPFSLSCHFTGKENYSVQMDGFLRIENPKLRFIPIAVKLNQNG